MRRFNTVFTGLLFFVIFFLAWEGVSRFDLVDPFFISSPSRMIKAGWQLFSSGFIYPHLWISAQEFFGGFSLAVFLGVILGLTIGSSRFIYNIFHPLLIA